MRRFYLMLGLFAALMAVPTTTRAATAASAEVVSWRWEAGKVPTETGRFAVPPSGAPGNALAVTDLGADGVSEILVGAGFGEEPEVRVLRGDGSVIRSFLVYDRGMLQGVTVAAGDLDGDGRAEIVTGTGPGANAHVRILDMHGKPKLNARGFFPYGEDFKGGVTVAVGDTDGDGKAEIITAPGPTGGPRLGVWSANGESKADIFAFDNTNLVGMSIAAGDLDADGKAEVVAALAGPSPAAVRVYDVSARVMRKEFAGINGGFAGGLNVAVGDADGDGKNEIFVAPNGGGGPHVHVFRGDGTAAGNFFAYDQAYRGGVLMGVGKSVDGPRIVTMPAGRADGGRAQHAKFIKISVKDQRLQAFEYGRLVKTFLVATGEKRFPTPIGDFSILEKPYKVNYTWSYGPGHPENYNLGWVTWNLRFYPHIYIHYAPWRSVFGVRGSHGCVNVSKADAQWIYDWADVKTPVTVEG
jgi:hypothetical protein